MVGGFALVLSCCCKGAALGRLGRGGARDNEGNGAKAKDADELWNGTWPGRTRLRKLPAGQVQRCG